MAMRYSLPVVIAAFGVPACVSQAQLPEDGDGCFAASPGRFIRE